MHFMKLSSAVKRLPVNAFLSSTPRILIVACSPRIISLIAPSNTFHPLCTFSSWPSNLPTANDWGYGRKGPGTWPEKYPDAGGKNQSPIDILSELVQTREYDPPLRWSYGSRICKSMVNTGCGWRIDVQGNSELSGGPLKHSYELVQFHCHWGEGSHCGSEHVVDGKSYAGELHFVHWNKDQFSSCAEAIPSSKGLTVIGVFLEIGEKNSEIEKIIDAIPKIAKKNERVELECDISPVAMFPPTDQAYWTYSGSLTTPPCYESVTWIMFKNPITVSEAQLDCFRHMKKTSADEENVGFVEHNYRPPQLLNDRQICECTLP